jgi:PAS domain-containing protein
MSAQSQDISEASRTGPVAALDEARRLRRTMRDLVALSTLPAVWSGLGREGIARSLSDALLSTLSLDLVYVRMTAAARPIVEIARCKGRDTAREDAAKAVLRKMLEAGRGELPLTIPEPLGPRSLNATVIHFGIGADQGILVAGCARADFPGEQDRLLLGLGANQAAIVLQRRQVEEQLHDQREWLQVTLASIADAVIATDIAGRVTFLNPAAQALTAGRAWEASGLP